jgi:drug/metabolite transporter (DMT)-like permease
MRRARRPEPARVPGLLVLTGLSGAALAAVAYGAATVLQTLGVRELSALDANASAWQRVIAGRLYALGLALDGLGFLASLAALRRLPLFLVESTVASSVAVTAVLAVFVLHAHLRSAEIAALGVISAGLVLLALTAKAGPARHVGGTAGWLLLVSVVPVTVVLVVGMRDRVAGRGAVALATAAGLGFGLVGIAARCLNVRHPWWLTVHDPIVWALAAHGVLASVAYALALHRGRTTTVAAITFAVETVFPAAVGLAVLGDSIRAHLVAVAAIGFLATLCGSIALAGYAETPAPAPALQ